MESFSLVSDQAYCAQVRHKGAVDVSNMINKYMYIIFVNFIHRIVLELFGRCLRWPSVRTGHW